MFQLVGDMLLSDIGSLYWHKPQQDAPCRILKMSINGALKICSFSSWGLYVLIVCSHPFIKYSHRLLAKTSAKCSMPHPEHKLQRSVISFS